MEGGETIPALLGAAVACGEIAGAVALVARHDAVDVHLAGYQDLAERTPMRRDTIFRILSMTKPLLATAALMLVEDGKLGLDAPVDPWLPELVSTADDYLAFVRMLAGKGRGPGGRILSEASVLAMLTDQITPAQKAVSPFAPGFWDENGWGFGGAVVTRTGASGFPPGSYGWMGGYGTSFVVDPARGRTAILLTQRLMRSLDDVALTVKVQSLASNLEEPT